MSKAFDLREEKFSMAFDDSAGAVLVVTGNISIAAPHKVLSPFLERVHQAVLSESGKEIRVDIRPLEFISSSAIRPLVDWVWWVRDLPVERQYRLRFQHDPARTWQKRFLSAMSYFASNLMSFDG